MVDPGHGSALGMACNRARSAERSSRTMIALSPVRSPLGRLGIPGFGELPSGFSEREYLLANPAVAPAVETGTVRSGAQHWLTAGRHGNRRLTLSPPLPGEFDPKAYLEMSPDVAQAIAQGHFPPHRLVSRSMAGARAASGKELAAGRTARITAICPHPRAHPAPIANLTFGATGRKRERVW